MGGGVPDWRAALPDWLGGSEKDRREWGEGGKVAACTEFKRDRARKKSQGEEKGGEKAPGIEKEEGAGRKWEGRRRRIWKEEGKEGKG